MPPRFTQKRAETTHEALVHAAAKTFAARGYDATQTPDIARAAGVSTGAFYRHFTDKRAVLIEVLRRHLDDGRRTVDAELRPERFIGADAAQAIDTVIDVLFALIKKHAAISRVYITMSLTDPEIGKLRAQAEALDRATLARMIATAVPSDVAPNPEAAAMVVQIAALEVAAERAGLRPRVGPHVSDADAKLALREMLRRYLLPGAAASPSRDARPSRGKARHHKVK